MRYSVMKRLGDVCEAQTMSEKLWNLRIHVMCRMGWFENENGILEVTIG